MKEEVKEEEEAHEAKMKSIRKPKQSRRFLPYNQMKQKEREEEEEECQQDDKHPRHQGKKSELQLEDDQKSLLDRLQHPEEDVRERAIVSIANLSDSVDVSMLKELIDENILLSLLKNLKEGSLLIVSDAFYAIINLIEIEHQINKKVDPALKKAKQAPVIGISRFFIEKGLLLHVQQIVSDCFKQCNQAVTQMTQEMQNDISIIINSSYYLLSILCEVVDKQLLVVVADTDLALSNTGLAFQLVPYYLSTKNSTFHRVVQTVLEYVQVVTECSHKQNQYCLQYLQAMYDMLQKQEGGQYHNIKIVTVSIILNLINNNQVPKTEQSKVLMESIAASINQILDVNILSEVGNLCSILHQSEGTQHVQAQTAK